MGERHLYTQGRVRLRDDIWGGSARAPLRDLLLAIVAYVVLAAVAAYLVLAAGASL